MNEYVNKRQPYSAEICFKIVKNDFICVKQTFCLTLGQGRGHSLLWL